ncbi:MAG: Spx/MgsR family RNA polymerase-binding regulatory protein, partial [Oscillospiraceae bacterium]|nr:Spx/MgsR family RNA polymerase-binding regulatory protein [Oscillospiraceae bacterium]
DDNGIKYEERHIKEQRPTVNDLKNWHRKSGADLKKFFNTSGMLYRELDIKNKIKIMNEDDQFELLASDGMLVKRPVLVADSFVLIGFKQDEWEAKLK